jgi:metallo-beta-lactamase family protein
MARLTFYGATGTVTGSRFLLEMGKSKYLIDCGLFQGSKKNRLRNWEPFPKNPSEIDRVLLTHAHIDHTGYLPRFCRDGFAGAVHCTYPTSDLLEILLKDSAHIQEEDAEWANKKGFSKHKPALPLYTIEDAENALTFLKPCYYGQDLFVEEDVRIKFKDAGHILGSAFVDIRTGAGKNAKKILFGGDLGRPHQPILRDPVQVYDVDYLVLESTYGDRLHENHSPENSLADVINDSIKRGGILLIPSFAVGRTQTLLYTIRELEEQKRIPQIPVYIDSPMAIDTTTIFENRKEEHDLESRVQYLQGKNIFHPKRLQICRSRNQSKEINTRRERAIIISSSGMVNGGRILHHMIERLPHSENTVLFVGYQAEGTRGRALLEGKEKIKIHGGYIPVKAKMENISGFSGHADYDEILAWLMGTNKPPQKTFLVHGEPEASQSLKKKIEQQFGWDVVIPEFEESFDLNL